jgi:UPF0755 protein
MVAAAGVAWWLFVPYAGFRGEVFVDIERGTGTRGIAGELARAGVIRSRLQFDAIRLLRPRVALQAGEYRFARADSPWRVFDRIGRGDVFYYELTIPEGSNMFDIAAAVDQLGFLNGADFLKAARNPALIRDIAPTAPALEGFLFPSTYRITRHATEAQLCRIMTGEFRHQWSLLNAPPGASVVRVVTMASMVEKETAIPAERPEVASVYYNRLDRGMALDCDPTTIYAALLERRYRGTIYRSDLASTNAYNTYTHTGLPPGPVANPGAASLKAALEPAATSYLYFVAKPDGSGSHRFSSDLEAHNRAVEEYRRGIRQNQQTPAASGVPAAKPVVRHR